MSTRLYASNLPLSAKVEKLTTRFCKVGSVRSVALETPASRRGAFIEMNTSAKALEAIAALNLSNFDGRPVSVYLALAGVPRTL